MAWTRKEKKQLKTQSLAGIEDTLTLREQPVDKRLDWLYEQIAALEAVNRSLCLRLLDGFSYKEIAEMVGISESNVGYLLNKSG